MSAGARRMLPALTAGLLLGCATVELRPSAHTTVEIAGRPGLDVDVSAMILSEDMLVDEAGADSRLVFSIELDNRDVVPAHFDPSEIRLVVRVPGAPETQLASTSSGWDRPPTNEPLTRALPVELRPHERRAVWVVFPVPPALPSGAPAPPSTLALALDIEGTPSEVLVAGPTGPRWLEPTTGPLHMGLSNALIVAPNTVGDALALRTDFDGFVHVAAGPFASRRAGQSAIGVAFSLQVDAPVHLRLARAIRVTPTFSVDSALARSSYPERYPDAEVGLLGVTAGVEIGFGTLRPPSADRLPLQYAWPLAPFSIRLAYARWWSLRADESFGDAGRSGLTAALAVRFGP
jgi:hypothetical protein